MAIYTTLLRTIIENGNPISLNNYPIFDENYRPTLNQNIINYFYFQEIGFETVAMFNFELNAKMCLIMPRYNLMYKAANMQIDPLQNYNLTETYKRAYEGNANSKASSGSLNLYSDTPQGNVDTENITTLNYLSSADQSRNNGNSSENQNSNENYERNTSGQQGIPSYDMIAKYMESLKNIDQMIINELKPLFMGVW